MSQYDIDIREKLKKLHKNTVYATKKITGRLYKLFGSEVHSVLLYTATKITKFTHKIRKKQMLVVHTTHVFLSNACLIDLSTLTSRSLASLVSTLTYV